MWEQFKACGQVCSVRIWFASFFVLFSFLLWAALTSVFVNVCMLLQDILIFPLFHPLLQSSWRTRRFRGRRKWYWRGKRKKQPGRQWGHGWMRSRPGSSPPWWKLTTKPTMPPILTSPASGLVQYKVSSFFSTMNMVGPGHDVMQQNGGFPQDIILHFAVKSKLIQKHFISSTQVT